MSTREDTNSSLLNQSILDLIYHEKDRIMRKGPQGFIGLGIAIFYFYCIPKLLYPLYCLISSYDIKILILIGIPVVAGSSRVGFNLIINHIYTSKYPYFEQYRIMNTLWPWEVDKEGYSKQYRGIIINTIIGNIVILPILLYGLIYFNLVEFVSSPDSYPSSAEIFKHIMI